MTDPESGRCAEERRVEIELSSSRDGTDRAAEHPAESSGAPFHASNLAKALTPAGDLGSSRRNLLLVTRKREADDLRRLCTSVREVAPEISTFVLVDRKRSRLDPAWLLRPRRPTLAISFRNPRHFHPSLPAFYHGRGLRKSEELAALERAGIPVPRWTVLHRDETPDLEGFGPYLVSKPDRGASGAEVRIRKTSRVQWRASYTDRVAQIAGRVDDNLLQEFVYTGPWPVSYRVTTLFGKVLFALRCEADHGRRPTRDRWDFKGGGISIVAGAVGARYGLTFDPEVIRLGERAHAAFPDIPLLGFDILRDCNSGRLYVIEANSDGWVWGFSNRMGRSVQETWNFDLEGQFDGIRKAACVLAEKTRELAR